MATNSVVINLVVKDGNASSVVSQVQRNLERLGQSGNNASRNLERLGQSGNNASRGLRSSVTSVQAASAALRDLNGDITHNIRAVERFITTIPGVGSALLAAFPVVGGLAFGTMIVELIVKMAKFVEETRNVSTRLQTGFDQLHDSAQIAGDALRITNDGLEIQIAKLEHKPENRLKQALDEAGQSADQLADSLGKDISKVNELITQNKVNALGKFMGQKGTEDSIKFVSDTLAAIENVKRDYTIAIDAAIRDNATPQNITDLKTAEMTRLEGIYSAAEKANNPILREQRNQLDMFQKSHGGVGQDQRANVAIRSGFANLMQDQQEKIGESFYTDTLKAKQGSLQGQKDASEDAKKADEQRLKSLEAADVRRQQIYGKNLFTEQVYWANLTNAFKAGSSEYDAVQRKLLEAQKATGAAEVEVLKKAREVRERDAEEMLHMGETGGALSKATSEDILHTGSRYTQFRSELSKSEAQPEAQRNALEGMNIAQEQAAGTVSRLGIAQQVAALHAREYAEAVADLERRLADLANQDLNSEQYQAQALGIRNQMGELSGRNAVQSAEDMTAIDDTRLRTAWSQSLNHFVQDAQDTAKQIGDIFSGSLGAVNGSLSTAMTAYYRTNHERVRALREGLSSEVRGGAGRLANFGLQRAEGGVLGALGFGKGKPDGSLGNPLYVKIANALASANSTTSGILGKAGGWLSGLLGMGKSAIPTIATSGGLDPLGLVAPSIIQGMFANGGNLVANRPAIIGERGPELWMPRTAGTIIPNSALNGSDVHHHYAIDARGSTDPAATHVAVMRGIQQAMPSIISASMAAHTDRNRRVASSKRT